MTRDEVYDLCLQKIEQNKKLLIELPTGFGKTKVAIDLLNHFGNTENFKVLLLVAKKVHRQTWTDEITKWGGTKATIVTDCYESLKKHQGETFDMLIMDEVHHIKSDLRLELLQTMTFKYMIGLSATIPKKLLLWFNWKYKPALVSSSLQEAIVDEVLPSPKILLIPLHIDNKVKCEWVEVNKRMRGKPAIDVYENLWKYKKKPAVLQCTKKQKLMELNRQILQMKRAFERTRNIGIKNRWLQLCGVRLSFLANCKSPMVAKLLKQLKDKRTLTFCNSIEQAVLLGQHCIHSRNNVAGETLDNFNAGKFKHITAVRMLDEGVNLTNCQYGIFANINSSETIQVQRIGRLLRHKEPKIVIPYYVDSREEEIVQKMLQGYDPKLIINYNYLDGNI